MTDDDHAAGASQAAIEAHYDVGNEFYKLWLDETLTYSAALWDGPDDTRGLGAAQAAKIAWHLQQAEVVKARRVLDIGCGWGATLKACAALLNVVSGIGLTLSPAQAAYAASLGNPKLEVHVENWQQHKPAALYESIISIGAFEHFTKPTDEAAAKIAIYRDFFGHCRGWLDSRGAMSLQTIAYGSLSRDDPSVALMSQIFPESDLPMLEEIVMACAGLFEIVSLRNDRLDYSRTCEIWASNLRARRAEAGALVGPDQLRRYERYLKLSAMGFLTGKLWLLRFKLKPV